MPKLSRPYAKEAARPTLSSIHWTLNAAFGSQTVQELYVNCASLSSLYTPTMSIIFEERQKMTQWWLQLIFGGLTLVPIYGLYQQLVKGEDFGTNPMPNIGLVLFALLMLGLMILIRTMELKTRIDEEAIDMEYRPLARKRILWKDVASASVLSYGFVGGWGVRLGTSYGTVYNAKGNKGLALVLKDGKKLLIGTQKEAELKEVVQRCLSPEQQ